tara:strand:- start:3230 stop:3373 length:144 start_codon:yes stop_codon:yes gene_type:complete
MLQFIKIKNIMRKVYSKTIYKNGRIEWNLTEKDYNYKIKKIKSYEKK